MHPIRPHGLTMRVLTGVWSLALLSLGACATQAPSPDVPVTVFEGARLIVGDGQVIEEAVFIVDGATFAGVGRRGELTVPANATRIDLTGRTVMPALVDTHTHLGRTREALIDDLERRAYYGVGVVMSLGRDEGDLPFEVRDEPMPNAARLRTAGRGITSPEPGRSDIPYWVTTETEARQAVQELAARQVDLVKIWVDDRGGAYEKLGPELYGAVIDEAHRHGLRVTAHIFALEDAKALLRAGLDAFAHGVRDRDVDDEFVAMVRARPDVILVPNLPDRGVATDMSWLRESLPAEELERCRRRPPIVPPPRRRSASRPATWPAARRRHAHRDGDGRQHALGPARRDGRHGGGRHAARRRDRGRHPHVGRPAAGGRCRHGRGRPERRLHRARGEPARRHYQYAPDRRRLPARHGGRAGRVARPLDAGRRLHDTLRASAIAPRSARAHRHAPSRRAQARRATPARQGRASSARGATDHTGERPGIDRVAGEHPVQARRTEVKGGHLGKQVSEVRRASQVPPVVQLLRFQSRARSRSTRPPRTSPPSTSMQFACPWSVPPDPFSRTVRPNSDIVSTTVSPARSPRSS
jgi:hypothetical protein